MVVRKKKKYTDKKLLNKCVVPWNTKKSRWSQVYKVPTLFLKTNIQQPIKWWGRPPRSQSNLCCYPFRPLKSHIHQWWWLDLALGVWWARQTCHAWSPTRFSYACSLALYGQQKEDIVRVISYAHRILYSTHRRKHVRHQQEASLDGS